MDNKNVLNIMLAGDEYFIVVELKEILFKKLDIKAEDIMEIRKFPNTLVRNEEDSTLMVV